MIGERMAALGTREKGAIALAMVCIFVVLVDRFALTYIVGRFRDLNASIQVEATDLANDLRILRSGGTVLGEYERVKGVLSEASSSSAAADQLKAEIDELAAASRVNILAIKHRETRQSEFLEEQVVEIERFESGTKELLAFLHRLATSGNMLKVERLAVAPNRETGALTGTMLICKLMRLSGQKGETTEAQKGTGRSSGAGSG